MKATVSGPGSAITRAASILSIPMSSMTMATIGLPPEGGMARANCCQAGLPDGAGGVSGIEAAGEIAGAAGGVAGPTGGVAVVDGASFGGVAATDRLAT